ncbi:MAG: IclR family transcriptional regulator [Acidobacteriota bacterium]
MPKEDVYYIELIGKTLDVLETFVKSPQPQLSLSDISHQLQLNKNSVFRILYSLAEHGYVVKDNQKYELGPKLLELGNARMRHNDLLSIATPPLQALRDRFGETVNLGILDQDVIRYIGVWESRDRLRLAERVGATDMLHCSALGKVLLAYLPSSEVRSLIGTKRLPAMTRHTITSAVALTAELETIRKQGYSTDAEESMLGAFCVACAIIDPARNRPIASFSMSGPTVRMTRERVTEISRALRAAAAEVAEKLGSGSPRATGPSRKSTPARKGARKKNTSVALSD